MLRSRVVNKRPSRRLRDRGIVEQELRILNQRGELVMRMLGSVLVARRATDPEDST